MMFILLPLCLAVQAQGASFDCNQATGKVEQIICADTGLSMLDEDLDKQVGGALRPFSSQIRQNALQKETGLCRITGGVRSKKIRGALRPLLGINFYNSTRTPPLKENLWTGKSATASATGSRT